MLSFAAVVLLGSAASASPTAAIRPLPGQVIVMPVPPVVTETSGKWRWLVFSDRLWKRIPGGTFEKGSLVPKGMVEVIEVTISLEAREEIPNSLSGPVVFFSQRYKSGLVREGEHVDLPGQVLFETTARPQGVNQKVDLGSMIISRASTKMIYAQAEPIDLAQYNFPSPKARLLLAKTDDKGKILEVGSTRICDLGSDLDAVPKLNTDEEALAERGFRVTWSVPRQPDNDVVSLNLLAAKK
jgi:hypothetical protein